MQMRIGKKYLLYALLITSSFITAAVTALDSYISSVYIKNPWAFGFALFFIGFFSTFFLTVVLSIPYKRKSLGSRLIDPSFKRIRFIKKKELKYNLAAGFMNATNTIGYCVLISLVYDPSVLLSFSQIVILYLLLIESFTEKNIPTLAEIQSSVIVTFGAILASISLQGEIDIPSLVIVFLLINPTWAFFSIYQRKLKMIRINGKLNDSINIRFWNVAVSFLFIFIIILIWDIFFGTNYFFEGVNASFAFFPWIFLTMGITFFAYVLFIRSLGIGSASVSNAIRSSTIIFGLPFSFILASYGLSPFIADPVMLLIKLIGMILIVLGIISFALTIVKAYIFIEINLVIPEKIFYTNYGIYLVSHMFLQQLVNMIL